jgi:hypothetical protein
MDGIATDRIDQCGHSKSVTGIVEVQPHLRSAVEGSLSIRRHRSADSPRPPGANRITNACYGLGAASVRGRKSHRLRTDISRMIMRWPTALLAFCIDSGRGDSSQSAFSCSSTNSVPTMSSSPSRVAMRFGEIAATWGQSSTPPGRAAGTAALPGPDR